MKMARNAILILLAGLFLAACVGVNGEPLALRFEEVAPAEAAPATNNAVSPFGTTSTESNLLGALSYIPAGLDQLMFTDWAAIHTAMGLDRSRDRITDEWMLALNREHVAATVYGGFHMRDHRADWGWDTLDLEWEALLAAGDLPPIYMLKFYDGFDFAPVIEHFDERGFTREAHMGVPVYSHEIDAAQEWVRTTELAIHNVAILEDERLMILTSVPEVVPAVLQALESGETLVNDAAAHDVAQRLAGAATAVILAGADSCLSFSPNPVLGAVGEETTDMDRLLEDSLPAKPQAMYTGLGLGYYYPGTGEMAVHASSGVNPDDAYWLVVLHYPSTEVATLDLAPRLTLAEDAKSVAADMPYSDLYSVEAATVADSDILLALVPAPERRKSVLLTMLTHRDMLFASCP